MLVAIDLSRHSNCYIANIVKCRPPNNREPSPSECDACIGYLRAQIDILQPGFILCVGRIAAHSLLRLSDPISRLRVGASIFKEFLSIVTFHPSALLRDTALKRPAWEDLNNSARSWKAEPLKKQSHKEGKMTVTTQISKLEE